MDLSMHNRINHHANVLNGMWRNSSGKLARVADDVLKFGAYHVKYKLLWWRLNIVHNIPNLEVNKLNPSRLQTK